jgi:hypothetical protein
MNKAIIDTRVTSTTLLNNLMNLDDYMPTCNSNFELFNQHAKINYMGLEASVENVPSFVVYAFKGYKVAADDNFRKYIQSQQGKSLDHYTLRIRELIKYKTMLEDKE